MQITPISRSLALAALCLAALVFPAPAEEAPGRPNIVILLADDVAFMDLGIYGGEARTPNIDALARRGALFTGYRTSPLCAPSRAMLLTGIDSHLTGVATIPEVLTEEQKGQPGYTMALEPGIATLAARLKAAGYRTLMTGKWHLGSRAEDLPPAHGFDRSFALDASGADNWEDKSYMPYYADAPWFEDGRPARLPKDFYSSDFVVDRMLDYLGATPAEAPFFAYLSFLAVHIPVQAPAHLTAGYAGTYDEGWHALREARWQRAQALGYIPEGAPLQSMPERFRSWDAMPEDERAVYAARMQVNAAMLEAMDLAIGRFVEALKASGEYDNTLFIMTSDNGPEPSRGDDDHRLAFWMRMNGYHIGIDGIGERGSWGFIGPEWAMAAASPFDLFKFHGSEGGIRVPMVLAGPGVPAGARVDSFSFVTDLAPTLLDLAGVPLAQDGAKDITGRSLVPVLTGAAEHTYGPDEAVGIEVSGNAAIYLGRWKITRNQLPNGDGTWRLHDLETDPGETRDLAADEPEVMARMLAAYDAYAARVGVIEVPPGYNSRAQIVRNTEARQLQRLLPWLIAGGFGAILLIAGLIFALSRLMRRRRT
ncbi:sulfatase-like hydrolase/transferase [Hyphomonas sp.]|uniref:sulfatase-like hydrolase/transferase n=1 Tax=Hyphomonas sp. TaxID=87 RepID=UPI003919763B